MVVGPAGSGKTHSLLIPWMYAALDSGWSVVAVDVKGDLREDFLDFKERFGSGTLGAGLTKWDFMNALQSSPWEFLRELTDEARVDAAVTAILGGASRTPAPTRSSTSATTARCVACCCSRAPRCRTCAPRRT